MAKRRGLRPLTVRVRGVNKVRAPKDKGGRIYYYHRKTGVRLQAEFGTTAFFLELDRLNTERPAMPRKQPGTWGGLVGTYQTSPEYMILAPRTKSDYQKVFDWMAPLDGLPVLQLDGPAVIGIRDKAFKQKKRRFTNHVLQVIGTVMNWGRPRNLSAGYPLAGQKRIKIPRPRDLPRANRPWTDDEMIAVLGAAEGGLKLAIALACYAGMRSQDIPRVTWSIYDGARLEWQQGKTGDTVWVPAHRDLRALLDTAPRSAVTIVTGVLGRPTAEAGLRKAFRQLVLRLEKEERIGPDLTLHGRRHTIGDQLSDLGADPKMIQAILGHRSMTASLHYSAGASRRRAATAAVHLLEGRPRKLQNQRAVLQNGPDRAD